MSNQIIETFTFFNVSLSIVICFMGNNTQPNVEIFHKLIENYY